MRTLSLLYLYLSITNRKNYTHHNSALFRRVEEDSEGHPGWYANVFDSIFLYLDAGVPKDKIVVGMPMYGFGSVLNDIESNGLYCSTETYMQAVNM